MARKKLKWKHEPFEIPEELIDSWREIGSKGEKLEEEWNNILSKKNTKIKEQYDRLIKGELPIELEKIFGDEKLKFLEFIILELFVFVLLEPLKSAEPPINSGRKAEIFSIAAIEHCRVAKFGFDSKFLSFS